MKDLETLTACPICDGSFGKMMHENYYRCNDCGAQVRTPRMTDEATEKYYQSEYRRLCPTDAAQKLQHAARVMKQMVLTRSLWTSGYMLELGCSNGYLMRLFAKIGYHCIGVDPDQCFKDDETVAWFPTLSEVVEMPFDVIAISHTLEHFNHPREELERLIDIYARNGTRFLIEVPNVGRCNMALAYRPHHPFAWNSASLSWLLEAVGLSVIFEATHSSELPGEDNLLMVAEL